MPVTTQHDLQRERILGACRLAAVAAAAGVDAAAWASTTSPRVVTSDAAGYVAGLHRGRLPMVEVIHAADAWDRQAIAGGTIDATWTVRVHVNGSGWGAADSLARAVLQVCLAAIRSDSYLREGEEAIGPLQADPLGYHLDCQVTLAHTYCRATYETDATITPGSPVVVIPSIGGYAALVSIGTLSPSTFYDMPATARVDIVEVQVLEAWDGSGATIQVGVAGDPGRFFSGTDLELTEAGTTWRKDFDDAGPIAFRVTITPGSGATTGQARIQITTTQVGT